MLLDAVTRAILEHYTAQPPRTEDAWYGPWTAILTSLFPITHGYLVTPQQCLPIDDQNHIPRLYYRGRQDIYTASRIPDGLDCQNQEHAALAQRDPSPEAPVGKADGRRFCGNRQGRNVLDWRDWAPLAVW